MKVDAEGSATPKDGKNSTVFEVVASSNKSSTSKYKKISIDINSLSPVDCVVATNVNHKFPVTNEEDPRYYLKLALWDSDDMSVFNMLDQNLPVRMNIMEIVYEIAMHCDGAKNRDNCGFDKFDVPTMQRVMEHGIDSWNSRDVQRLGQRLCRYGRQVRGNVIDRIFIGRV
jgi:hypothetical protein